MRIEYNPGDAARGAASYAICHPDTPHSGLGWMWIHGIGERSDGRVEDLQNLVMGFDYNQDGKREPSVIPSNIFQAVDKYGITLVIPAYRNFFEPSILNAVREDVMAKYGLNARFVLDGFSLGGGAVIKYITTSNENAKNVVVAIPVAPTSAGVNWAIPSQEKLPIHFFVNDKDTNGPTNLSVTKSCVTKLAPVAEYTAFRADGHGGVDSSHSLTPPVAVGGQGVINLVETIWDWALDVFKNGPRPMKADTATKPIDPVIVQPSTLTASINLTDGQVITTNTLQLDASASLGVKAGADGYVWDIVPEIWPKNLQVVGGAWGGPLKTITGLENGGYKIGLTVKDSKGGTARKEVRVVVKIGTTQPVPKTVQSFNSSTDLITYNDGSTEKGTATVDWVSKKVVLIAESGTTYNL